MTQEHPITPPPELRQLWAQQAQRMDPHDPVAWQQHVATQAARWGWNQCMKLDHAWLEAKMQEAKDEELEACCEWLETGPYGFSIEATAPSMTKRLRAARRSKPPSLKEQALTELNLTADPEGAELSRTQVELIRRALESLPD